MVQINPELLNESPKRPQKTPQGAITGLIKSVVKDAVNPAGIESKLQQISEVLSQFVQQQRNMTVGKASLETQKIDEFHVSNLEELKLENVESLSFALEQLEPIIKALTSSNKNEQVSQEILNRIVAQLTTLSGEMAKLSKKEIIIPETQKVTGAVSVTEMPESSQISQVINLLGELKNSFVSMHKGKEKKENKVELAEGKMLEEKLSKVIEALEKIPDNINFPTTVSVDNFPPQKYPMPVTHMSINSLAGFAKSNVVTVGTSAVPLPGEILAYRRSVLVYNNSASVTLYVGGSDVTTSNGMPVPPKSYSPAFDAGPKMVVYGIAGSSIEVRVLELSDENSGR